VAETAVAVGIVVAAVPEVAEVIVVAEAVAVVVGIVVVEEVAAAEEAVEEEEEDRIYSFPTGLELVISLMQTNLPFLFAKKLK